MKNKAVNPYEQQDRSPDRDFYHGEHTDMNTYCLTVGQLLTPWRTRRKEITQ